MIQPPTQPTVLAFAPGLHEPPDPRGLGGLVAMAEEGERPPPLAAVRVRAAIAGDVCRTEIEQHFTNPLDAALEAVHIFPLPEDGAVVALTLEAGAVTVRAELRERAAAEQAFAAARQAGHRAALLTAERADVHTLRVTNLPPRTDVTVRIVVVERLATVDGRRRWRFPTVIAPRYVPGTPTGPAGPGMLPDTDRVPDAARLQPPLRLAGGTRLDLEVDIAGPITALASSLHAVRIDIGPTAPAGEPASGAPAGGDVDAAGPAGESRRGDGDKAVAASAQGPVPAPAAGHVRVAPSFQATLDRDFILAFSTAEADAATARAWTDGAYTLLNVDPPADRLPPTLPRDAVFVIDVSGSMTGVKIDAARRALSTALHGLAAGDRFRVIAFNDRVQVHGDGFVDYTQTTLDAADAWIRRLSATGGTEMLAPIQAALAGDTPPGRLRTVLFVTDGQVWNDAELVAAVARGRDRAVFFTMGIDTAVNAALLRRLARVGGGTCTLMTPYDDIEAAAAGIESRFGGPVATDVVVDGIAAAALATDVAPRLFTGHPASLLFEGSPPSLRVTARVAGGETGWEVAPTRIDFPLAALWARDRVAALEDQLVVSPEAVEAARAQITRIALAHGIASRFTAFVAVDNSVVQDGERVEIVQPAELPMGWDPSFLEMAGGGAPPVLGAMPGVADVAQWNAAFTGIRMTAMDAGAPEASGALQRLHRRVTRTSQGRAQKPGSEGATDAPMPARAGGGPPGQTDLSGQLARLQGADGGFGADPVRTAAAVVALLLLGHTRRAGIRQRVVAKAAAWLEAVAAADGAARLVLAALAAVESGAEPQAAVAALGAVVDQLEAAGEEGRILARVRAAGPAG